MGGGDRERNLQNGVRMYLLERALDVGFKWRCYLLLFSDIVSSPAKKKAVPKDGLFASVGEAGSATQTYPPTDSSDDNLRPTWFRYSFLRAMGAEKAAEGTRNSFPS